MVGATGDGAALARGEELGRVERADGERAPGARGPAVGERADRLGAVLDERDAEREELVEADREPERVDGDDRAGPSRAAPRRVLGRQAERLGVGVGQHRGGAAPGHRVVERVARVGGHDDLIARARAEGAQRQLEGGAARAHRGGRRHAEPGRQLPLEGGDLLSLREVTRADDTRHAPDVLLAERRSRVGDHRDPARG